MTTRSLGYESQKFILQYMDPNTRILLNKNCPSLRVPNKMVPLHISNAHLDTTGLTINDTKYKFGARPYHIERQLRDAVKTEEFLRINDHDDFYSDHRRREIEKEMQKEKENEQRKKRVEEVVSLLSLSESFERTPEGLHENEDLEVELLRDQIRRHEMNPPVLKLYYAFNKLEIHSPGKKTQVLEPILNKRQWALCVDYFFCQVFSGFKKICFKKLGIFMCPQSPYVFSVVGGNIRSNIKFRSFSNPSVSTLVLQGPADYSNNLIKGAKVLIIVGYAEPNCLLRVSNTEVIRKPGFFYSIPGIRDLIEDWRNKLHPIGRKYSIQLEEKHLVGRIMNSIELIPGGVNGKVKESRGGPFPHCVTFPMSNTAELNVYAGTSLLINPEMIRTKGWEVLYYIIFQIHPKGHATPLRI